MIYTPFLQSAFSTMPLTAADWGICAATASSVLWLCELGKIVMRQWNGRRRPARQGTSDAVDDSENDEERELVS